MCDHSVIADITNTVLETAGETGMNVTIEIELYEQGGYKLYASSPGHGAEPIALHREQFKNPHIRERLAIVEEAAHRLAEEYGDAWYRERVQYEQSHARLVAQGALEYE